MARGLRFERRLMVLETIVLPLHHPHIGQGSRTRTDDLTAPNRAFYQLNYTLWWLRLDLHQRPSVLQTDALLLSYKASILNVLLKKRPVF